MEKVSESEFVPIQRTNIASSRKRVQPQAAQLTDGEICLIEAKAKIRRADAEYALDKLQSPEQSPVAHAKGCKICETVPKGMLKQIDDWAKYMPVNWIADQFGGQYSPVEVREHIIATSTRARGVKAGAPYTERLLQHLTAVEEICLEALHQAKPNKLADVLIECYKIELALAGVQAPLEGGAGTITINVNAERERMADIRRKFGVRDPGTEIIIEPSNSQTDIIDTNLEAETTIQVDMEVN